MQIAPEVTYNYIKMNDPVTISFEYGITSKAINVMIIIGEKKGSYFAWGFAFKIPPVASFMLCI